MAYIVQRCAEDFNLPSYWRISGISEITLSALRQEMATADPSVS